MNLFSGGTAGAFGGAAFNL